jgi:hypothetical protein
MAILLDRNGYSSVRPNFNIRDDAATFDDALHGALNIGFGELGFRHYCSAKDEVSKTRASFFGLMPAAFVRITPIAIREVEARAFKEGLPYQRGAVPSNPLSLCMERALTSLCGNWR